MTGYLYDGDCVVAEFDAQGKVRAQYIHGQGLGADVGSLICAQTLGDGGAMLERYYSHNWRGDVIGITDESGASLARYRYGAFGELIAGDGAIANNILFSGKRYDSATGLYYFGARYYDASSGRFISRDPMGYIDGPNDYVLAMNNPLLWIDPWGLCRWFADVGYSTASLGAALLVFPEPTGVSKAVSTVVYGVAATAFAVSAVSNIVSNWDTIQGTVSYGVNTAWDTLQGSVSYGYNSAKSWIETIPSFNTSSSYEYVPGQVLSTGPMITPGQSTNITDNVYTFPSYTGSTYIESVPAQQRNASDNYLFSNTKPERESGQYAPPPLTLQAFPDAKPAKRIGNRATFIDSDGNKYTWDSRHHAVEKFSKNGVNLGKYDPNTGEQKRGPDPKRNL